MKNILITGCAGFIGMHLSKRCLDLGFTVIGIDNLNAYYDVNLKQNRLEILKKHRNFVFYQQSIEDEQYKLDDIVKKHNCQLIVNLAAQCGVRYSVENPDLYIQSNIVGFSKILECCRHNNIKKLIFASSSSTYGNSDKIPFSESDQTDKPVSLYAATKKTNELMAYAYSNLYNIQTIGLRFFTVYGPYGRPDMAPMLFAKAVLNNEPIKIFNNGNLLRDFTYIDDIINGIMNVINSNINSKYEIYNIGKGSPDKLMDFISILEQELGITANKEFLPMQHGDVYQTYADIRKMKHDFNYAAAVDLKTGIKKFITWYKNYFSKM